MPLRVHQDLARHIGQWQDSQMLSTWVRLDLTGMTSHSLWVQLLECFFFAIRSNKAFGNLFKIKAWRSFSPFSLLCNAAFISSDSCLMFFLVIKSETSQFVSLFFFTTFFGVFGWDIFSVFVAEERLFLAFDWNFLLYFL